MFVESILLRPVFHQLSEDLEKSIHPSAATSFSFKARVQMDKSIPPSLFLSPPLCVIRHHNQGNLQKREFVLAYSSREVQNPLCQGGLAATSRLDSRRKKQLPPHTQSREHLDMGQAMNSQGRPIQVKGFLQQEHTISELPSNSTINWEPSIQLWEPTGDILIQTSIIVCVCGGVVKYQVTCLWAGYHFLPYSFGIRPPAGLETKMEVSKS